jgi:glycosidase
MRHSVDEAYRLGMYLLTSMGKYPVLYQGDELMQRGLKWNGNPSQQSKDPGDGSGIFDETLREPFPWRRAGSEPPQTGWFRPRFDAPDDDVSVEEQERHGSMLDLVRALGKLRVQNPGFANGEVGEILADTAECLGFEKVSGQDRFLVLVNYSGSAIEYRFRVGSSLRYIGAQLVFWSDGQKKAWKNESAKKTLIDREVLVPPYGFVLLKQPRDR